MLHRTGNEVVSIQKKAVMTFILEGSQRNTCAAPLRGSLLQQVFEHGASAGLSRDGDRREGGQGVRDGLHEQVTRRASGTRAGPRQQRHGGGARGQEGVGLAGSSSASCREAGDSLCYVWKIKTREPLKKKTKRQRPGRSSAHRGRLPADADVAVFLEGGAFKGLMSWTGSLGAGSDGVDSISRNLTNISEKD